MPIFIEKLVDEPIIVVTYANPINYYGEVEGMFARILELRETIHDASKYYVLMDMTGIKPVFSEILHGLNHARKTSAKRRADLPISLHLVGTGALFELVANALSQRQYGNYAAPLYKTSEEAMDAIRTEIRASATDSPS